MRLRVASLSPLARGEGLRTLAPDKGESVLRDASDTSSRGGRIPSLSKERPSRRATCPRLLRMTRVDEGTSVADLYAYPVLGAGFDVEVIAQ